MSFLVTGWLPEKSTRSVSVSKSSGSRSRSRSSRCCDHLLGKTRREEEGAREGYEGTGCTIKHTRQLPGRRSASALACSPREQSHEAQSQEAGSTENKAQSTAEVEESISDAIRRMEEEDRKKSHKRKSPFHQYGDHQAGETPITFLQYENVSCLELIGRWRRCTTSVNQIRSYYIFGDINPCQKEWEDMKRCFVCKFKKGGTAGEDCWRDYIQTRETNHPTPASPVNTIWEPRAENERPDYGGTRSGDDATTSNDDTIAAADNASPQDTDPSEDGSL